MGRARRTVSSRSLLVLQLGLSLSLASTAVAAEFDQHGKAHALDGSSGRYTVVDFAATWCKPCLRSLPELEKLASSYPQLDFVVISVDDREAGRDQLVEQLGLTLPVIWDQDYRLAETFAPEAMPATFVVDLNGEVIYSHTGFDEDVWAELVELIDSL